MEIEKKIKETHIEVIAERERWGERKKSKLKKKKEYLLKHLLLHWHIEYDRDLMQNEVDPMKLRKKKSKKR